MPKSHTEQGINSDLRWQGLYKAGGAAALLAGVLFRRNIAAEIALFSRHSPPETVGGWFALLQRDRLLGLAYLNVFDLLNYLLIGLMLLALYAVLRQTAKSLASIAASLGFLGIAVYLASNTAFSMLSLSAQYAAAHSAAQRGPLLAAGQALLALNRFSAPGADPGAAGLLSLFLVALAGVLFAAAMWRSAAFNRAAASAGILAGALDLAYCLAYVFIPAADSGRLAVLFIPAAGLFWMLWHLLAGWRLLRLGRRPA